jgi:hypothetical protein
MAASATLPSLVLVELSSLSELNFPANSSTRFKVGRDSGLKWMCNMFTLQYTCVSASLHYLVVGSTSGSVYVFNRYAAKHRAAGAVHNTVPVVVLALNVCDG